MEFNINSPSYYKNVYGVDDEIYGMCQDIYCFLKDKQYSEIIDTIGICPIIAPDDLIQQGKWREETVYDIPYKLIIVKRHIDYNKYVNATVDQKKKMIVANILCSVKSIKNKGKIDFARFEKDILSFLGYNRDEVMNI